MSYIGCCWWSGLQLLAMLRLYVLCTANAACNRDTKHELRRYFSGPTPMVHPDNAHARTTNQQRGTYELHIDNARTTIYPCLWRERPTCLKVDRPRRQTCEPTWSLPADIHIAVDVERATPREAPRTTSGAVKALANCPPARARTNAANSLMVVTVEWMYWSLKQSL